MFYLLLDLLTNPQFLFAGASAIAVAATVLTLAMPMLAKNDLQLRKQRMVVERDKIRARERARLAEEQKFGKRKKAEPKAYMREVVDRLGLRQKLIREGTKDKLNQAGYRGDGAVVIYLFARLVVPFIIFLLAIIYLFGIGRFEQPPIVRLGIAFAVGFAGFYLPDIMVKNQIEKRQLNIKRAWPDAMDLLLICVEAGMSIEQAFKKVADEISIQSIPLSEELALTNAELSYLNDRRQAYENLGKRTGLEGVKSVMTSLIQADRYGTPVGQALRVLAKENRDMRMSEAEKKAAGLPPKLTVPMIVFFLPCLFVVIIGPAAIQVMALD